MGACAAPAGRSRGDPRRVRAPLPRGPGSRHIPPAWGSREEQALGLFWLLAALSSISCVGLLTRSVGAAAPGGAQNNTFVRAALGRKPLLGSEGQRGAPAPRAVPPTARPALGTGGRTPEVLAQIVLRPCLHHSPQVLVLGVCWTPSVAETSWRREAGGLWCPRGAGELGKVAEGGWQWPAGPSGDFQVAAAGHSPCVASVALLPRGWKQLGAVPVPAGSPLPPVCANLASLGTSESPRTPQGARQLGTGRAGAARLVAACPVGPRTPSLSPSCPLPAACGQQGRSSRGQGGMAGAGAGPGGPWGACSPPAPVGRHRTPSPRRAGAKQVAKKWCRCVVSKPCIIKILFEQMSQEASGLLSRLGAAKFFWPRAAELGVSVPLAPAGHGRA